MLQSVIELWLPLLAIIVGVVYSTLYMVSLRSHVERLKVESSRFPMFAVRSELVELVASSAVKQDDRGWSLAYNSANDLLGLHQILDLPEIVRRIVNASIRESRDEKYQQRREEFVHAIEVTAQSVPEFATAVIRLHAAMFHMAFRRTTLFQRAWLSAVLAMAKVFVYLGGGSKAAQSLKKTVVEPDELPPMDHTDSACDSVSDVEYGEFVTHQAQSISGESLSPKIASSVARWGTMQTA